MQVTTTDHDTLHAVTRDILPRALRAARLPETAAARESGKLPLAEVARIVANAEALVPAEVLAHHTTRTRFAEWVDVSRLPHYLRDDATFAMDLARRATILGEYLSATQARGIGQRLAGAVVAAAMPPKGTRDALIMAVARVRARRTRQSVANEVRRVRPVIEAHDAVAALLGQPSLAAELASAPNVDAAALKLSLALRRARLEMAIGEERAVLVEVGS